MKTLRYAYLICILVVLFLGYMLLISITYSQSDHGELRLSDDVTVRKLAEGVWLHTVDNIVVWIPAKKILFAGCLVKSLNAKTIGNIEDADLDAYPITLRKIRQTFPDGKIVVPGHGRPGGLDLIDHTINLQIRTSNSDVIEFYQAIGYSIDDVVSMGKRLEQDER